MSAVEYLFMFGKAFFVVMFAMNVAVILTWADRRYGAMLQDRVGPERAVIWLPQRLAQGLAFLPAVLVGLGVWHFAEANKEDAASMPGNAMLLSQGAIFMTWFNAIVIAGAVKRRGVRGSFDRFIRSIGNPRIFFYAGLVAHVGVLLLAGLLGDSDSGAVVREITYRGGAMLLAVVVVVSGAVYSA